tara:strand:- start:1650 stop:2315 length:666 start_codon:yes stop_codon:yes gene_type:complete
MKYDFIIGTVRFNNKTYIENLNWKHKKDFIGCAYGLDKKIPSNINKPIYVIEMNNTVNKIMGIGKIKNIQSNRTRMYKEERYNRYLYKGQYFISRLDIIKNIDKGDIVLKLLENELFRGATHFKRGQGCIIFPWERIARIGQKAEMQKRKYRCGKCGLIAKNHICKNKLLKIKKINKKCKICGKVKKGHICQAIKKNILLEKYIYNWFNNLFIQQYPPHSH